MTKTPEAVIFNGITGETTIRPLTSQEILERKELQIRQEKLEAEQEAKIAARQSALAKLAELGLTEDEIAAL
jgi:DNA-binding NarL/FixJ family response regulator